MRVISLFIHKKKGEREKRGGEGWREDGGEEGGGGGTRVCTMAPTTVWMKYTRTTGSVPRADQSAQQVQQRQPITSTLNWVRRRYAARAGRSVAGAPCAEAKTDSTSSGRQHDFLILKYRNMS